MEETLENYRETIIKIADSLNEDSSPHSLKFNCVKILELLDKMKAKDPNSIDREIIELSGTIEDEINLADISEGINKKKGTKKSQKDYEDRIYKALSQIKSDLHFIIYHTKKI